MNSLQAAPAEIYNLYLQTASNIVTHVDDSLRNNMLTELTNMIETSCMLDLKLKQSSEIFERLTAQQDEQNEDLEALNHAEILKQFKNEVSGMNVDVSTHKKFLEFKQQVKELLDDAQTKDKDDVGDEELVVTQKEINVIDPITRRRIVDPVKNTACGHVYDRESVLALLKGNKHTRCPVMGCPSKDYIQTDNLQTDMRTKKYLERNPE